MVARGGTVRCRAAGVVVVELCRICYFPFDFKVLNLFKVLRTFTRCSRWSVPTRPANEHNAQEYLSRTRPAHSRSDLQRQLDDALWRETATDPLRKSALG